MTLFTQQQVYDLAIRARMTSENARILAAISMCEAPAYVPGEPMADFSRVGDVALADETWGYSYGGLQIRSLRSQKGTGKTRDEDRLLDPEFNVRSARAIKIAAGSFRPWSTFTSGMYKAYLLDDQGDIAFPPPPGTYRVVAGDSLSKIASVRFANQWPWTEWARVNGIHEPYLLRIGDFLMIPGAPDTPGA